jgi:ABC-type multidrug transport system permease subunit
MLWIVVLWVVFSFVVAAGARNRGRSGFLWFFGAVLVSPIIAGIALVVLGSRKRIE